MKGQSVIAYSRRWAPLAALVAAYLLIAGLYAALTPAWQAPDEPAHYTYALQVAREGCCPVIALGDWDSAYLDRLKSARFAPELLGDLETIQYEDHQPPLYYLLARAWTPDPAPETLVRMRLLSVLLGAGLVIAAYAAARALALSPAAALGTAALVAFLPQQVHLLASVNNDALALLLVALTLLLSLWYVRGERQPALYPLLTAAGMLAAFGGAAVLGDLLRLPVNLTAALAALGSGGLLVYAVRRWRRQPQDRRLRVTAWMLGLLVGLGLLTKVSTLIAAAAALLAVLLKWRADRQAANQPPSSANAARAITPAGAPLAHPRVPPAPAVYPLLRDTALLALPALLLGGLWWLRNSAIYGFPDIFGLRAHDAVVFDQLRTADLIAQVGWSGYLSQALTTTFNSFWGQFGWMAAPLPAWAYAALALLLALAALGWLLPLPGWPRRFRALHGIPALLAALALLAYLYYNTAFVQFQGRYLYPGLIPLALALAAGTDRLRRRLPAPLSGDSGLWPYATALPFALLLPLNIYLLWRVLIPALAV
jgi:hypothetical protein